MNGYAQRVPMISAKGINLCTNFSYAYPNTFINTLSKNGKLKRLEVVFYF